MRFVFLLLLVLLILGCGTASELRKAPTEKKWVRFYTSWSMAVWDEILDDRRRLNPFIEFLVGYLKTLSFLMLPSGGGIAFARYNSEITLPGWYLSWDWGGVFFFDKMYVGAASFRFINLYCKGGVIPGFLFAAGAGGRWWPLSNSVAILFSMGVGWEFVPLPPFDEPTEWEWVGLARLGLEFMLKPNLLTTFRLEFPYIEVSRSFESNLTMFFIGARITSFLWMGGSIGRVL